MGNESWGTFKPEINLLGFIFFCLSFGDFLFHCSLGVFIVKGFDRNRIYELFQVIRNIIFPLGCLFPPFSGLFQLKNKTMIFFCLFWGELRPTWYTVFILYLSSKRSDSRNCLRDIYPLNTTLGMNTKWEKVWKLPRGQYPKCSLVLPERSGGGLYFHFISSL